MERNPTVTDLEPFVENREPTDPPAVCSCGAARHATDPHRCTRGHALGGNSLSRKHIVDENRRAKLRERILADYQPETQRLRSMCFQFADICEQLEGRKADGSANYQRLVQLSQQLGAALEESRASRTSHPPIDQIDTLDPPALIEKTVGLLRQLLQLQDQQAVAPVAPVTHAPATSGKFPEGSEPSAHVPTPTPTPCPYCYRSPCIGTAHSAYEVLHWNAPDEFEKRRVARTKEMFAMIGKPSPFI
jgi:hypothetical protein